MKEDSTSNPQCIEPPPTVEPENESARSFWDDHLLQYNPSFKLGHPYLQGRWHAYQDEKRQHIIRSVVTGIFLVLLALASTRLPYFFLYYIVPALCLGYGIFSMRKWNQKNAQLAAREKLLHEASEALKLQTTAIVQYSVEEIGQSKMNVIQRCAPTVRIVIEGAKSVPKYCGSWRIGNWQTLSESDRLGLHTEYKSYITGKVWHHAGQSFALLTDTGTVLWLV